MSQRFTFDFNWKLSLAVLIFLPILVKLSYWQLERAEEKDALARNWQLQQSAPPIEFDSIDKNSATSFQRVSIEGQFLGDQFWLKENQIHNGNIGYNVIMPFRALDGDIIPVDRGWVKGSPLRDFVPEVPTPKAQLRISGTLVVPTDSKLIREAETSVKAWPHKILEVDIPVMRNQSNLDLYGRLLKIDVDSMGALDVYWQPINMSPAMHYGYALQWGLMAVVLVILYVFASTNLMELLRHRVRKAPQNNE